jgi:hypothetical protein
MQLIQFLIYLAAKAREYFFFVTCSPFIFSGHSIKRERLPGAMVIILIFCSGICFEDRCGSTFSSKAVF